MAIHAIQIHAVSGVSASTAERCDPGCLDVLIVGLPEALRCVAQLMMGGPLDAEFDGQQVRMTSFTVQNQGDRGRLVFRATYRPTALPSPGREGVGA